MLELCFNTFCTTSLNGKFWHFKKMIIASWSLKGNMAKSTLCKGVLLDKISFSLFVTVFCYSRSNRRRLIRIVFYDLYI